MRAAGRRSCSRASRVSHGHRLRWGGSRPGRVATAGRSGRRRVRPHTPAPDRPGTAGRTCLPRWRDAVDRPAWPPAGPERRPGVEHGRHRRRADEAPGQRPDRRARPAALAPNSSTAKTTSPDPSTAAARCSPGWRCSAAATTVSAQVASAPPSSAASTANTRAYREETGPQGGTEPRRHGQRSSARTKHHPGRQKPIRPAMNGMSTSARWPASARPWIPAPATGSP